MFRLTNVTLPKLSLGEYCEKVGHLPISFDERFTAILCDILISAPIGHFRNYNTYTKSSEPIDKCPNFPTASEDFQESCNRSLN